MRTALLVLWALGFAARAAAQYDVGWATVDGGGGAATGGGAFVVAGTTGQPDAGGPHAAGRTRCTPASGRSPRPGPYGTLVGQGTALEPATGLAFDSFLVPRHG